MSKILKNWWKLMKIANIDREVLHIFRTTWRILMKFSGKMFLVIILKLTRSQCFTFFVEDAFLKNHRGVGGQIDPSSRFRDKEERSFVWFLLMIYGIFNFERMLLYSKNRLGAYFKNIVFLRSITAQALF